MLTSPSTLLKALIRSISFSVIPFFLAGRSSIRAGAESEKRGGFVSCLSACIVTPSASSSGCCWLESCLVHGSPLKAMFTVVFLIRDTTFQVKEILFHS